MSVVWKDPPRKDKRVAWPKRLEPLKSRPGDWALVHTAGTENSAISTVNRLENKRDLNMPEGQFEFSRDGKNIYARYLGSEVKAGKVKGLPSTAPTQSARSSYERSTSPHP